eukprot:gene15073-16628_t
MERKAALQRFFMWLCGSTAVFGFIALLVAYLIYDGKSCAQSSPCDTSAELVKAQQENLILKIIGPVFLASGIIGMILVRCWQTSSTNTTNNTATAEDGNTNGGFHGTTSDFGSPPSYADALHMQIIVEGRVQFPHEPPPKYIDVIAQMDEAPLRRGSSTADGVPGNSSQMITESRDSSPQHESENSSPQHENEDSSPQHENEDSSPQHENETVGDDSVLNNIENDNEQVMVTHDDNYYVI